MKNIRALTAGLLLTTASPLALAVDTAAPDAGTTSAAPDSETGAPPVSAQVQNRLVEEVVVTAQKREENLQEVPISIQAFSADALAARGVEKTDQLGQAVPSLQFTQVAGYTLIYMRGIGTDNFIPSADPSIATYLDGIYIPTGHSMSNSLGNVVRVEVLKGPQGTLFGRNSTGGAVSIVTEDAGNIAKSALEAAYAHDKNGGQVATLKGDTTLPMNDWLSINVAGLYSKGDGYFSNVNYTVPKEVFRAGRLKIGLRPTDDLSINLTSYRSKQSGSSSVLGKNTDPSLIGSTFAQPAKDDYKTDSDLYGFGDGGQTLNYGTVTWELPYLDIKFLGSDQKTLTDFTQIDFDGTPVPIAAFDAANEYVDMKTGELQFISNNDTPFADRFKWVAGLYYLKSTAGFDPAHLKVAPQGFSSILDILQVEDPLSAALQDLASLLPAGNTPLEDGGLQVAFSGVLGTKSTSAFFQGTWYFNEQWDLTFGGRLQRERRYLTKSETRLSNLTGGGGSVSQPFDPDGSLTLLRFDLGSETATNFSPKVVLSYHPNDSSMLYASYSTGFKSGTYNVVNIYTPPQYIVPEKVTTYELGAKSDLFGGILRANGALFWNEIDDLQSGFVSLLSGGAVQFYTAGSARTRGVEVDFTLLPLPDLNPGLALTGNAAYVDSEYLNLTQGRGFDETTGIYEANGQYSGNEIVRSPELSGSLGAVQAIDFGSGTLELGADVYYNSGFYYDAKNTVEEDAYQVINGRISYLYTPWDLRVTAFGQNLADHRYHVQQFQNDFGIIKTLAPPRVFGVRLNWTF